MAQKLLVIFAKNPKKGKVKTRLAKTIGEDKALEVYLSLLKITERASLGLKHADVIVYYTDYEFTDYWQGIRQEKQIDGNLGEKMWDAFQRGFAEGYRTIIGIGTDLAELSVEILETAFITLETSDLVFGPSADGGYYLVGMREITTRYIFENKPWSTNTLLTETLAEANLMHHNAALLETLNDIDTESDLAQTHLATKFL
jgi:rSAM/selenodomain-associated transferase 1